MLDRKESRGNLESNNIMYLKFRSKEIICLVIFVQISSGLRCMCVSISKIKFKLFMGLEDDEETF